MNLFYIPVTETATVAELKSISKGTYLSAKLARARRVPNRTLVSRAPSKFTNV